jgi:uncharacterized protein YciW
MQMTAINSINVNAREGIFISQFVGFITWQLSSIAAANSFSGQNLGIWKADAEKKSEDHASHINFTHYRTGAP